MNNRTVMTNNTPIKPNRNSTGFLLAFLIGALMLIMTICVAFTLTPTIARALAGLPTPTSQVPSWSLAKIAKATYTPSAQPTFTNLPISKPQLPSTTNPTSIAVPTVMGMPTFAVTPIFTPVVIPDASQIASPLQMNLVEDSPTPESAMNDNSGGKYILVSISKQHLYAYDNGQLVFDFIASTGMHNSTRVGTFSVLDKIPNAYGSTWNIWMPDWLGIYYSGNLEDGIHALPILPDGNRLWSGYLGSPISYGCVVLGVDEALQLYNWADIGTPVEIQP